MCTPIGNDASHYGSYFGLNLAEYDEEKELKNALEASLKCLEQDKEKMNSIGVDTSLSNEAVKHEEGVLKKEEVKKADTQKSDKVGEEKVEILLPTKNEKWTEQKIGWVEQFAISAFQKTVMRSVIEWRVRKVSDKSWERIAKLDFYSYKRLGQFEEFAISLIKEAEYGDEEKKRVHQKVKEMLKLYSEQGLVGLAKKAAS